MEVSCLKLTNSTISLNEWNRCVFFVFSEFFSDYLRLSVNINIDNYV